MSDSPRRRFAALAEMAGDALPLAEGALLLAAEEYPTLDIPRYLGVFDALAEDGSRHIPARGGPEESAAALCRFLSILQQFRGNTEEYSDPRNSFLNEVLDRRLGIPISLAVVYIEVGRRLGLPVYGVGMPAHFLVGYESRHGPLFVDAFHGAVLTAEGCQRVFQEMTRGAALFHAEYLAPTPPRFILVRMLRNLKGIYLQRGDLDRSGAAIERILLLAPDLADEARDLGLVRYRQGKLREAKDLLERYLAEAPADAADRPAMEIHLTQIRSLLTRLN
jgi:regulator of sirC expression with transglutaminase-like and TPR domain